jgi:uncharacterized membrane protein YbhN (UPF0104 family)
VIAAVDLGASLDRFGDAAETFFENLAAIDLTALGVALAFYLAHLLARTRAWRNVLQAAYPRTKVSYSRISAAYLVGAGLNSFIPARVGDVVKIFLAKRSIRGSSYPAITSSFFVQSVFDTPVGILVLLYAITQGLLPEPPELPTIPAFDISFWAENPQLLLFTITALGIAAVITFAVLARRVEEFWAHVKQGVVVLTDLRLYLRTVFLWQAIGWGLRFFAIWFFLEAFGLEGSFENVLLVMSVVAVSTVLPFTPGGAGAQQALLVATLSGASRAAVLSYSVGQQLAIAVWTVILGFIALLTVFRTANWRGLIRDAEADVDRDRREGQVGGRDGTTHRQGGSSERGKT